MQSAGRLRFLLDSSSKRVLTEISNLVSGSNTRCRGRSFAASVPLETPRVRKIRKWVSKDERQAILEEYINTYRSRNSGKFPTASYINKEVGGSYYVVRKILQELEYKSKLSSSNTGNETSNKKELAKENEGSNDFKKNMSRHITLDDKIHKDGQAIAINGVDTSDTSCMHPEVKKGPNVSVPFDKIESVPHIDCSKSKAEDHKSLPEYSCAGKLEDIKEETPCKSMLDIDDSKSKVEEQQPQPKYPCPKKPEDVKEQTTYESVLDIDGSKSKVEKHQSLPELEKFGRNLEDIKDETTCKSMLDIDGSKSKVEEQQPPPECSCPKKREDVKEETIYESVLDIDGSKSKVEKHQSLPELEKFGRNLEDIKDETTCKSMLDIDGSKSKVEEQQPPPVCPCPKKREDVKEETTYESVLDIDGSKSKVEKHQSSLELEKFVRDLTEKQMEENTMKKSSIWANLKSVAEGIINIWRKR